MSEEQNRQIDPDIDLNVFDESEWEFLNVSSKDQNFEYFKDVEDFNVQTPREHLASILKFGIVAGIMGVTIVLGTSYLFYNYMKPYISSDTEVSALTSDITTTLERVEGNQVDSDTLINVSNVLNGYFSVYSSNSKLSELNGYCMSNSNFATTEEYYRTTAKASYDANDCYARGLKCFSKYISLNRVNEIIEKDGIYYAYIDIKAPKEEDLFQHYNSYKYSMTKYFSMYLLDTANVTKYLTEINADGTLPTKDMEICIKLGTADGVYKIIDDSQITSICTETLNTSVASVCNILGSSLTTT